MTDTQTPTTEREGEIRVRILNPVMGVPISYLDKHDPEQFEILGMVGPSVDGKNIYKRILIRRRTPPTVAES